MAAELRALVGRQACRHGIGFSRSKLSWRSRQWTFKHPTNSPTIAQTGERGIKSFGRGHLNTARPSLRIQILWGWNMKPRISGNDATYVAMEAAKRGPIRVDASDGLDQAAKNVPASSGSLKATSDRRKAPPRIRKPSPHHDQCLAPTPDLNGHRERLREAFGNTMSDEFVDVILGKLVEALRPSPFDTLEEPTLNAGLALINSIQPRSELEALMAVQIVATGVSGLRFLRQSHRHMTEDFIDVYGGYAIKLLRLQTDLIQALDRHRRGNRQTVEVHHVHVYPGSQGVIGIVNSAPTEGSD